MHSEKEVFVPEELLELMSIEKTLFTPENPHIGIIILTEIENTNHIVHIYRLELSSTSDHYNIAQELAGFSFQNREDAEDFMESLPNMGGLEMLMLLNPMEESPSHLN